MKRAFFVIALLMMFTSVHAQLNNDIDLAKTEITTEEISQAVLNCNDCHDWRIVGGCAWLRCSLFGCSVEVSVQVQHFNPDLVISTYTFRSPWTEAADLNNTQDGTVTQEDLHKDTTNNQRLGSYLDFKHGDAIGNPALLIYDQVAGQMDYWCESSVNMFQPYLLSSLDPTWKGGFLERIMPQAILGIPKIETQIQLGILSGYWGSEFPRCGWAAHPFDAINSAVAAHRIGHIVTHPQSQHVALSIDSDCGDGCWGPQGLEANKSSTGKFQPLAPELEHTAYTYGGSAWWADGRHEIDEAYSQVLWLPYRCCEPKGAFIGSVETNLIQDEPPPQRGRSFEIDLP